jgi:hypothetical protein
MPGRSTTGSPVAAAIDGGADFAHEPPDINPAGSARIDDGSLEPGAYEFRTSG